MPSRKRLLAAIPAVALLGAALSVPGAHASSSEANYEPAASDFYINYAPPRVEKETADPKVTGTAARKLTAAEKIDRKFTSGNPAAGRILAAREAQAVKTGRNPAEWLKKADQTRTAKLLTVLVEFNDQANDDFSGFRRPRTIGSGADDCVTEPPGTLLNGPLHNNIPNPATLPHKDNNSFWVPNFSTEHFNKMLYTDQGITERVRPDLTDPRDGKPGIDISGFTMKKMYEEMSKGAYSVTGSAVGWIKVPHSEAWYGASACGGAPQDMSGHPDNQLGAQQLPIDTVDALVKSQPNFPWADYDVEDVSDADGDGNFVEPDGVIDHLVLVHAGKDKSSDGGKEGTYAIWAHSSAVAGGYRIPGSDKKISNYIVQPEDSGVGVFAHEYGHDLGLPDLYDTSGAASSAVDFWDLMSSGSHSGPIFQSMPSHMGLWDKWVLGWADPKTFDPGDAQARVTVGQSSRTPKNTEDGVRVNLASSPLKMIDVHSGANAWWSGLDQDWANLKLTRDLTVPAGGDLKLWMWNNYEIEADWDYGFVEVSTDGGETWTQQKVFDEAGTEVTTPDDYPDPNKNLKTFGNKKYGLTGDTGGAWRHDYVNLTPFAGQTIKLRLSYNTDAAFQMRGWHVDDFQLTNGGTAVWSDDVEGGDNGWIAVGGTFTNTSGQGWTRNNGERDISRFYLAEWRNFDGFDNGLAYAYDTDYSREGSWKVSKLKYNAPGLLVWLRDSTYINNNIADNLRQPPSLGPKGSLLVVDSHFDPMRRTGVAAEKDPSLNKNLQGRAQTSDAAFGFGRPYNFRECLEAPEEPFSEYCTDIVGGRAVKTFTDAKTWFPGLEEIDGTLYYRDLDASVVVPSKGDQAYTTRVVHKNGTPATELYGQVAAGSVLGTGNPGDEGKALGVQFKLVKPLLNNIGAVVDVVPPAN